MEFLFSSESLHPPRMITIDMSSCNKGAVRTNGEADRMSDLEVDSGSRNDIGYEERPPISGFAAPPVPPRNQTHNRGFSFAGISLASTFENPEPMSTEETPREDCEADNNSQENDDTPDINAGQNNAPTPVISQRKMYSLPGNLRLQTANMVSPSSKPQIDTAVLEGRSMTLLEQHPFDELSEVSCMYMSMSIEESPTDEILKDVQDEFAQEKDAILPHLLNQKGNSFCGTEQYKAIVLDEPQKELDTEVGVQQTQPEENFAGETEKCNDTNDCALYVSEQQEEKISSSHVKADTQEDALTEEEPTNNSQAPSLVDIQPLKESVATEDQQENSKKGDEENCTINKAEDVNKDSAESEASSTGADRQAAQAALDQASADLLAINLVGRLEQESSIVEDIDEDNSASEISSIDINHYAAPTLLDRANTTLLSMEGVSASAIGRSKVLPAQNSGNTEQENTDVEGLQPQKLGNSDEANCVKDVELYDTQDEEEGGLVEKAMEELESCNFFREDSEKELKEGMKEIKNEKADVIGHSDLLDEKQTHSKNEADNDFGDTRDSIAYTVTRILAEGLLHKKGTGNDWLGSTEWKLRHAQLVLANIDGYQVPVPVLLIYWHRLTPTPSTVIVMDTAAIIRFDKEDKSQWDVYCFDVTQIISPIENVKRTFTASEQAREDWMYVINQAMADFEVRKDNAGKIEGNRKSMTGLNASTSGLRDKPEGDFETASVSVFSSENVEKELDPWDSSVSNIHEEAAKQVEMLEYLKMSICSVDEADIREIEEKREIIDEQDSEEQEEQDSSKVQSTRRDIFGEHTVAIDAPVQMKTEPIEDVEPAVEDIIAETDLQITTSASFEKTAESNVEQVSDELALTEEQPVVKAVESTVEMENMAIGNFKQDIKEDAEKEVAVQEAYFLNFVCSGLECASVAKSDEGDSEMKFERYEESREAFNVTERARETSLFDSDDADGGQDTGVAESGDEVQARDDECEEKSAAEQASGSKTPGQGGPCSLNEEVDAEIDVNQIKRVNLATSSDAQKGQNWPFCSH